MSCILFLEVRSSIQGIHVTINARHEDDLDESIVLEKVSKASGACVVYVCVYCSRDVLLLHQQYAQLIFEFVFSNILLTIGANFSFHKEKARAVPEQGRVVSTHCACVISVILLCSRDLYGRGIILSKKLIPEKEIHSGANKRYTIPHSTTPSGPVNNEHNVIVFAQQEEERRVASEKRSATELRKKEELERREREV